MYLLEKENYNKVLKLVKDNNICYPFVYEVIENRIPGYIYVDDKTNPKSSLIINRGGMYLLVGEEENFQFNKFLGEFLKDKNNHTRYFDLYASSNKWIDKMSRILEGHVVRLKRSIYTFNEIEAIDLNSKLSKTEFKLRRMDEELFHKYVREIDNSYKTHWGSAQDFLLNGFGFCLLKNDKFVSVCNSFYVGGEYVEIDIWTNSNYRRQGLAIITSSLLTEYCLQNGLTPIWNADAGNEASNKLAIKVGYKKIKDEDILWWHEDEKVIAEYLEKYNYND